MNTILNILKTVPLFASLSEEQHQSIIESITMEYYPAHHALFKKGDKGTAMYIVKSGMVRIFDGENEVATIAEGGFFGEMALIDAMPRNASAETLSDCELFVIKWDDFAALIQQSPAIELAIKDEYLARKQANQSKADNK